MIVKPGDSVMLKALPYDWQDKVMGVLPEGDVPKWSIDSSNSVSPLDQVSFVPTNDGLRCSVVFTKGALPGDYVFLVQDSVFPQAWGSHTLTIEGPRRFTVDPY